MSDPVAVPRDDEGFRAKLMRAARLSSLTFVAQVALRIVSVTILTRLLAPDIYGVFAVVLTYLYMLRMLSDLGIRPIILSAETEPDAAFLQTCWTIGALRGTAMLLVSIGVAALLDLAQARDLFDPESAYSAPELPLAIAAIGIVPFISSFVSPNQFMAERRMSFGRITALEISGHVAGLIVTIAMAWWLRSIWALVAGAMATQIIDTGGSHILFKGPPPRFRLDRAHIRTVLTRGIRILGNSALTMVAQTADRLVLGLAMEASTFGFYHIARQFVDIGAAFLNTVHQKSGMQVFTHLLKTRAGEVRRNYYRYRLFFDALAGTAAGGLFATAPLLVGILFDDRYAGVTPILRILCFSLLVIGPLTLSAAFMAERRFGLTALLTAMSAVTIWVGLGIAIQAGSTTLALGVVALHHLPQALTLMVLAARRGWVSWLREAIPLVFFGLGFVLGQGIMALWTLAV